MDRSGGKNKVDSVAAILIKEVFVSWFQKELEKVGEIKTGFYYIALKANVPLIPVAFDFGKKKSI
jgi:1-acyl-sn-glycerol-3-phosphate acyltransferase